jgi:hypothetical protein
MNYQNAYSLTTLFSIIALSTLSLVSCNSSETQGRYEAVQPAVAQTVQKQTPASELPAPGSD